LIASPEFEAQLLPHHCTARQQDGQKPGVPGIRHIASVGPLGGEMQSLS